MGSTASIAQNIDSIATYKGRYGFADITVAITSRIGAGTAQIFDAGTNGSICEKITVISKGTNTATAFRVFLEVGGTKRLVFEATLDAATATELAGQTIYTFPLNIKLNSGDKLYSSIGTTGTDGWSIAAHGGDF